MARPSIQQKVNSAILTFLTCNQQYKTYSICFIVNFVIIKRFWLSPKHQANMMQKKKTEQQMIKQTIANDEATLETKMWNKMNTF